LTKELKKLVYKRLREGVVIKMKIMKDKIADVVQGITGIYLFILFVFNFIGLPLQMGPVGMQVYDISKAC
jgi:hypothetical protein